MNASVLRRGYVARISGALTAAALVLGVPVFTSPAANATTSATSTAESSMGRVTMTAKSVEFDGDTATIPITFTMEKFNNPEWTEIEITIGSLSARQVGAREVLGSGGYVSWPRGSAKTGTNATTIVISGTDFVPGVPVLIYGSVDFANFHTTENIRKGVALTPVVSVTVTPEKTTLTDVAVDGSRIVGRASVESSVGRTGTGGFVAVRYKTGPKSPWVPVTEFVDCHSDICAYPNRRGEFTLDTKRPIPSGARVEVSLLGCGWCTDTTTVVRAR